MCIGLFGKGTGHILLKSTSEKFRNTYATKVVKDDSNVFFKIYFFGVPHLAHFLMNQDWA